MSHTSLFKPNFSALTHTGIWYCLLNLHNLPSPLKDLICSFVYLVGTCLPNNIYYYMYYHYSLVIYSSCLLSHEWQCMVHWWVLPIENCHFYWFCHFFCLSLASFAYSRNFEGRIALPVSSLLRVSTFGCGHHKRWIPIPVNFIIILIHIESVNK